MAERSAVMGWVLTCLAGNLWARMVSACAATALTILLFLLNLRHAGERAGWLGNAFHPCREHMQSNARCWTQPAAALGVAMIWLGGCAMVSSDPRASICPSVVEYSPAAQARTAQEITALPEGAVIIGWLADCSVLRGQARACLAGSS